jgi:hypothetical protein
MPWAREELAGYLTPAIRAVVRREVLDDARVREKLYGAPRIFDDLLSSQPLCFNLFGELAGDLDLAGVVGSRLWPDLVATVERIEFEWSPGRRVGSFLNNRSAFDVVWFVETPDGGRAVIGIEVKYHENMRVRAALHQDRYDVVAGRAGIFSPDAIDELVRPPLQQLWLDHLLVLSLGQADPELREVRFIVCAPDANAACAGVVARYRATIADPRSFGFLSLDTLTGALIDAGVPGSSELRDRYLPWTLPSYRPS